MVRIPLLLLVTGLFWLVAGCGQKTEEATTDGTSEATSAPAADGQVTTQTDAPDKPSPASLRPLKSVAPPSNNSIPTVTGPPANRAATKPGSARLRIPDDRPDVNEQRIAVAGIRCYRSRRLVLLSDLPEAEVAHLPALTDKLFDALEQHFGKLPPAVDDSEFQVTGCLIGDKEKFLSVGLMTNSEFTFAHGRHFNYEFWMYRQDDAYYQRHLLLHEFTHCFMTCECGMQNTPPSWYLEGMAELFGTHRLPDNETKLPEFCVMPDQFAGFEGWGRISEMRRAFEIEQLNEADSVRELPVPALADVMPDTVGRFTDWRQYATSWALCWFLHTHPDYRDSFRELRQVRTQRELITTAARIREQHQPKISVDWLLFMESLREGFDTQRSWPKHSDLTTAAETPGTGPRKLQLAADRSWQDSGIRLKAGDAVEVTCTGSFAVNDTPRPWVSEPQGVSVEYFRGLPLGRVVAVLTGLDGQYISRRISIGRQATIKTPVACRLWLQVNDNSSSRANNSGFVDVTIQSR